MEPKKQPSVGIILINWNAFGYTNDCLNSLSQIDYPNAQAIVVDNDSTDDSLAKLKIAHPDVLYVETNKNLGFTGGNNEGIKFALAQKFAYILLLNNDTFVEPDFLSKLVWAMEDQAHIGAAQSQIFHNHDRNLIWSAGGSYNPVISLPKSIGYGKKGGPAFNAPKEVEWVTGCTIMVRAEVIEKVGLLSDLFFYGAFDDVDWSFRMKEAGYKLVYVPDSVIYHAVGAAAKEKLDEKEATLKPFFHYLFNRNNFIFIRLHTKPLYLIPTIIYQVCKLGLYSGYFIARGRFRKLKAMWHGVFHGIFKPLKPEKMNHLHYIDLYK